jgi:hypothetical protein
MCSSFQLAKVELLPLVSTIQINRQRHRSVWVRRNVSTKLKTLYHHQNIIKKDLCMILSHCMPPGITAGVDEQLDSARNKRDQQFRNEKVSDFTPLRLT